MKKRVLLIVVLMVLVSVVSGGIFAESFGGEKYKKVSYACEHRFSHVPPYRRTLNFEECLSVLKIYKLAEDECLAHGLLYNLKQPLKVSNFSLSEKCEEETPKKYHGFKAHCGPYTSPNPANNQNNYPDECLTKYELIERAREICRIRRKLISYFEAVDECEEGEDCQDPCPSVSLPDCPDGVYVSLGKDDCGCDLGSVCNCPGECKELSKKCCITRDDCDPVYDLTTLDENNKASYVSCRKSLSKWNPIPIIEDIFDIIKGDDDKDDSTWDILEGLENSEDLGYLEDLIDNLEDLIDNLLGKEEEYSIKCPSEETCPEPVEKNGNVIITWEYKDGKCVAQPIGDESENGGGTEENGGDGTDDVSLPTCGEFSFGHAELGLCEYHSIQTGNWIYVRGTTSFAVEYTSENYNKYCQQEGVSCCSFNCEEEPATCSISKDRKTCTDAEGEHYSNPECIFTFGATTIHKGVKEWGCETEKCVETEYVCIPSASGDYCTYLSAGKWGCSYGKTLYKCNDLDNGCEDYTDKYTNYCKDEKTLIYYKCGGTSFSGMMECYQGSQICVDKCENGKCFGVAPLV